MEGRQVFIVAAKRTPIGSIGGKLAALRGPELAAAAIKGALQSINLDPKLVEEVILGNVCSAGVGQNPARQAALAAGLPIGVNCYSVNKVCASGMKSVMQASQTIQLGQADVIICGGFESMSNVPFYVTNHRKGQLFGNQTLVDGAAYDGLTNFYDNKAMGVCAEKTAADHKIDRKQNDEYCVESYERVLKALKTPEFKNDIVPVTVQNKIIDADEEPLRYNKAKIPQLKPAFTQNGVNTAANSSKLNDGACILILMSEQKVKELQIKPLAKVLSYADAEVEPVDFCIAPSVSGEKALKRANLALYQVDLFEFNEAFSVTAIANMKILNVPHDKVNVNGGAVSLGHPIGMSGARIIQNLITVLRQRNGKIGMAGICNGGGGGSSFILQLV
ncbi:hypothetical protein ABPG72_006783 [Tetrahymena utriculariae]